MKEREDLLKMKELCEKILAQTPDNALIKERLAAVNKKLKLMGWGKGKSLSKVIIKEKDKIDYI